MARFNFRDGFWLNLGGDILNPVRMRFEAGEQDVPDDVAGHWFLTEMGERVDVSAPVVDENEALEAPPKPKPPADDEQSTERDSLRARAAALGIVVDKRWGVSRLNAEIAAHEAPMDAETAIGPEEQAAAE